MTIEIALKVPSRLLYSILMIFASICEGHLHSRLYVDILLIEKYVFTLHFGTEHL